MKVKGAERRPEMNSARTHAASTRVVSPIAAATAHQERSQRSIQDRDQMRVIRSKRKRVARIGQEHLRERRKQDVEVKLRADGGDQPGKSDDACQQHDAERELGGVNGIGDNVLCTVFDRERERQRTRIEPRQVRKVCRAHPGEHAVRAQIEDTRETKNGLGVPFGPFAVDRRVEGKRQALHADDDQQAQNTPREEVRQSTRVSLHGWANGHEQNTLMMVLLSQRHQRRP
jgi:hypothetical protein